MQQPTTDKLCCDTVVSDTYFVDIERGRPKSR